MKTILLSILFSFFFFTLSCQKYTPSDLPDLQIHFGEGGGITGAITEYCLLKNGQIFQKEHFARPFTNLKKVKKRKAKKCFKTCKKIGFTEIDLNNPGDKYYFISYQDKGIDHRITWGRNKEEVPEEVLSLYRKLKAFVL